MAESNAEVARVLIEGLWSGDLDAARDHPGGYWPALHTFDYVRSAFPDLTATIKQQVVEGDRSSPTSSCQARIRPVPGRRANRAAGNVVCRLPGPIRGRQGYGAHRRRLDGRLLAIGAIPPPV